VDLSNGTGELTGSSADSNQQDGGIPAGTDGPAVDSSSGEGAAPASELEGNQGTSEKSDRPADEGESHLEANQVVDMQQTGASSSDTGANGTGNGVTGEAASIAQETEGLAAPEDTDADGDDMDADESSDEMDDSADDSAFDDDDLNSYVDEGDYGRAENDDGDDDDTADNDDSGDDEGSEDDDDDDNDNDDDDDDDDDHEEDDDETEYQPREFVYEMAQHACANTLQVPISAQGRAGWKTNSAAVADLAARVEKAKALYQQPTADPVAEDGVVKTEADGGDGAREQKHAETATSGSDEGAAVPHSNVDAGSVAPARRRKVSSVFYGNEAFYLFFRLHHILCDRMDRAFQLAERARTRRRRRVAPSPVDPHDKFLALLSQLLAAVSSSSASSEEAKVHFEEQIRQALGPNAYTLFNLSEIIERTVQRLHALACAQAGNAAVCQRLVELHSLHTARINAGRSRATPDLIDGIYRETVCNLLGPDVSCYKFEWSAPSSRNRHGILSIRLVEAGVTAPALCTEEQMRVATAYSNRLAAAADAAAPARRVFLKRNVRASAAPSRSARLADLVQINGLEMAVSVHYAHSPDEADEIAAAQRGYTSIVSASKRRRMTKPAGAPKRVVYVADTADVLYNRKRKLK
jgi:hypothetical protein